MNALIKIQNWLEEFKTRFKPIGIHFYPRDPDDPEDYFWDLIEHYGNGQEEYATFGIEVMSIEELGILMGYLRRKPGVKVLNHDDYELAVYNPDYPMMTYDSPEEVIKNTVGMDGNEISVRVDKEYFINFWKEFWEEYILELKYVPLTRRFLDYLKKHDL